jgi:hypothetical protein
MVKKIKQTQKSKCRPVSYHPSVRPLEIDARKSHGRKQKISEPGVRETPQEMV